MPLVRTPMTDRLLVMGGVLLWLDDERDHSLSLRRPHPETPEEDHHVVCFLVGPDLWGSGMIDSTRPIEAKSGSHRTHDLEMLYDSIVDGSTT